MKNITEQEAFDAAWEQECGAMPVETTKARALVTLGTSMLSLLVIGVVLYCATLGIQYLGNHPQHYANTIYR